MTSERSKANVKFLKRSDLQSLIDHLVDKGFDVIGPTISENAIVYRSLSNVNDLPRGWTDLQEPAVYRLQKDESDRFFRFNSSPDSWKRFFFPSSTEIGRATFSAEGWKFESPGTPPPQVALLGVRSCDLEAILVQDRVFRDNEFVDTAYRNRRDAAFLVAVNCSTATSTCFCTSMNTGPRCKRGFDLLLTEIESGFVIESGSASGAEVLAALNTSPMLPTQRKQADAEIENARDSISKRLDTESIHELLLNNLEHPNWAAVAERCLSCANCTMVCPTCFCSTVEEVANLSNTEVARVRSWDSCFNIDLSYTAGGIVRNDVRSRYRQWLTHKLATWIDQFDVSGCVGCGRCITWCPVGIDLTQEVAALRESQHDLPASGEAK